MFRRKEKTRLEQAREDLERVSEEIQEQANVAGEDVSERLRHTVEQIREEVDHLEDEARERGRAVLKNLEELSKRFREDVLKDEPEPAEDKIAWGLVLLAFGLGLIIGIILKNRD